MNVYDFDGTIYDGDSTVDFYKFCLKNYPKTHLAVFSAMISAMLYLFGIIKKTEFKQRFFGFLKYVPNIDNAVSAFWNSREHKIKPWYLKQKQSTDVIISASPEFLLEPVCNRLGAKLIASRVDKASGKFVSENCHDDEKVRRFKEMFGDERIREFYSDSLSDKSLAELAERAFMVKGEKITEWNVNG